MVNIISGEACPQCAAVGGSSWEKEKRKAKGEKEGRGREEKREGGDERVGKEHEEGEAGGGFEEEMERDVKGLEAETRGLSLGMGMAEASEAQEGEKEEKTLGRADHTPPPALALRARNVDSCISSADRDARELAVKAEAEALRIAEWVVVEEKQEIWARLSPSMSISQKLRQKEENGSSVVDVAAPSSVLNRVWGGLLGSAPTSTSASTTDVEVKMDGEGEVKKEESLVEEAKSEEIARGWIEVEPDNGGRVAEEKADQGGWRF